MQNFTPRPQAVTARRAAPYPQITPPGAANEWFRDSEATAHSHHLSRERPRWEKAFYFQSWVISISFPSSAQLNFGEQLPPTWDAISRVCHEGNWKVLQSDPLPRQGFTAPSRLPLSTVPIRSGKQKESYSWRTRYVRGIRETITRLAFKGL